VDTPIGPTGENLLPAADADRARRIARGLGSSGSPADGERLREVAKRFEALFYNQLLSSMRATVPENEFWGESSGTKIYRQLHDQELADRLADQGGLGVADLIVRQFESAVAREGGDTKTSETSIPAELTVRRRHGLDAYRRQSVTSPEAAALARLRRSAATMGGAVADTLGRHHRELATAASESGLDPALLLAVTMQESGGDPRAVSPKGAQGLMQLMPATARELGVQNAFDPAENLRGGSRYLARMLQRYDGDLDLALAAYNAGPGRVDAAGRAVPPFPETERYVERVKDLARRLKAESGTDLDTFRQRDHTSDSP
jgi:Rod binding domain-containing protein